MSISVLPRCVARSRTIVFTEHRTPRARPGSAEDIFSRVTYGLSTNTSIRLPCSVSYFRMNALVSIRANTDPTTLVQSGIVADFPSRPLQSPVRSYRSMASRYPRSAQKKVEKAIHEYKRGTLKSGSGTKVRSRKQAVAIGLSQARRAGARVPRGRQHSVTTRH